MARNAEEVAAPQEKPVTAAQMKKLRDKDQLSWAKVAEALNLGSPGAARRLYSSLVRPHTESVLARTLKQEGEAK